MTVYKRVRALSPLLIEAVFFFFSSSLFLRKAIERISANEKVIRESTGRNVVVAASDTVQVPIKSVNHKKDVPTKSWNA